MNHTINDSFRKAIEYCNKQCNNYKGCGKCLIQEACSASIGDPNKYRETVAKKYIEVFNAN